MLLIEFQHVQKHYPGSASPAVADLNLGVDAGEFLTLLGPSGSGKTTTLMLLAGFEAPSAGRILLDGQPIEALPPHQRNMGVVFQSYSLFPHLTVAQNVAFPLSVRKVPSAETAQRVQTALAKVRLEALGERKPHQLSGGQQQRVALARALVFEPRVVLMDEPLSALDKKLREEMQLEIRRLHRELGVTMVFVTHDQAEAMTLSDRVAVFNQGRIEQLDSPQALYDRPANPFVAGFLGDNNSLAGSVSLDGDVASLVVANGRWRGRAGPGLRPGPGQLCVRPEHLVVLPDEAALAPANATPAQLVDLIHQGDHWRAVLKLSAAEGTTWFAKLPAGQLASSLTPGQAVRVGFDAEHAWVF